MSSKRKFVVPAIDDSPPTEEAPVSGGTTFKKFRSQTQQHDKHINNDKTTSHASKPPVQHAEQPINQERLPTTSITHPKQLKSSSGEIPDKQIAGCSKVNDEQPPSAASGGGGNATKKKIGKTFGETFAYLKDTNLYKLPPIPQTTNNRKTENTNTIIVSARQRGNPILKHVRNIPWEYGEIVPDYEIGQKICVLFLSMRYHTLNPDYIHDRLKKLGHLYELRVLLVQVDVVNCKPSLKELGRIAMLSDYTLILAWSAEEAGRYLETYKQYENKPPDVLQQRVDADHLSKMQDFLTTIKSINRTDVITLISTFGSLKKIVNASLKEIGDCPGIGSLKATRLHQTFNETFKRNIRGYLREKLHDNKSIESDNATCSKFDTPTTNNAEKDITAADLPSTSKLKLPADVLSSDTNYLEENSEKQK